MAQVQGSVSAIFFENLSVDLIHDEAFDDDMVNRDRVSRAAGFRCIARAQYRYSKDIIVILLLKLNSENQKTTSLLLDV